VARWLPRQRLAVSRWSIRLGFVVVAALVAGSLGTGQIDVTEYDWRGPLAIILFCLLSQQTAMLPFRLRRWPRADTLSAGMEATMRNLNLAILLAAMLFPPPEKGQPEDPIRKGVIFVILYFAGVAIVCGTPLALRFRRMARREAAQLAAENGPQMNTDKHR
jgi:hypothetical protein